ncbi:MAG: hypothetical protein P8J50_02950 [Acidimicrobiales bacterium]|nr:hypothetical protein [Acidimicrobiales bacterium]
MSEDSPESNATSKAIEGELWAEFCDILKDSGQLVLDNSEDELDRLEGFRYLTRLLRSGLMNVEGVGRDFSRVNTTAYNVKIGSDNPDALYQSASVSGRYDYRLRGPRGTVNYLSLNAFSGGFGVGDDPPDRQGALAFNDPQPDELVEVIASANEPAHLEPGQRWLEMNEATNMIAIRNFFLDRTSERASELTIERLTGPRDLPPPLSAAKLTSGLYSSVLSTQGIAQRFIGKIDEWKQRPNTLDFQAEESTAGWNDPTQLFRHGYWTLEPGQALVIDVPLIEAYYWNFQLNNIWQESLDYEWRQVTVNKHTAVYESDGTARLIIADEDPGFGNWIDTSHHRHGGMGLRYNQVVEDIPPACRVMTIAELNDLRP